MFNSSFIKRKMVCWNFKKSGLYLGTFNPFWFLRCFKSGQAKALMSVWTVEEFLFMRHIFGRDINFNDADIFMVLGEQVKIVCLFRNSGNSKWMNCNHGIKSREMCSHICTCVCRYVLYILHIVCLCPRSPGNLLKMQLRIVSKVRSLISTLK